MDSPLPISTLPAFQLKTLKPKHKQIMSLLAQGLGRSEIAKIVGCTPEYVTVLTKQPLCIDYLREVSRFVDSRMEAMYEKSVDVIADLLNNGAAKERLAAAQLQLRSIGKGERMRVDAQVNHTHSLIGILASLPPRERITLDLPQSDPAAVVSTQ